jgi:hypothetical protein
MLMDKQLGVNTGQSFNMIDDSDRCNMIKSTGNEIPVPSIERRAEARVARLSNHRVEFKFPGVPVYQLKVRDISDRGAGVVVKADSNFVAMIAVGQELTMKLLSPVESKSRVGLYRSRIEHISELKSGRFKGHLVVGISLLREVNSF